MATYEMDEKFIKDIWQRSQVADSVKGYTLAYVSSAPKTKLVEAQIKVMGSRAIGKKKLEDTLRFERAKGNLFVYVKDDETTEENNDKHATLKQLTLLNPAIYASIQSGGTNTMRSKSGKKLEEDIISAKLTNFIDLDGQLHSLNELPIAYVTRSDDEVSYKTFLTTFKTAKTNCAEFADLRRKSIVDANGNEKNYIYAEVKPELYEKWLQTNASGTFKENMQMLVNNIRLDLDQCANSCKEYTLLEPNFEKGQTLTEENRAYISKNFTQSICLIGSPAFNKGFMSACYANITNKNGNLYPVDDLMFLPDKKTVDQIVEYLDKQNEYQQENPVGLTDEEKAKAVKNVLARGYSNDQSNKDKYVVFLSELAAEENNMEQEKIIAQNQVTLEFIKKMHPRFKLSEIEFDVEKESLRTVLSYYRSLQELRNRMNYRDPETDRIISMKSAYDLGYSDKERDELVNAFGDFGGQIYDRAYFIKFANYMLDVYKTTGALYDLTSVTKNFDNPTTEGMKLDAVIAKMRMKGIEDPIQMETKIMALYDAASLENYMALVKRFNGAINIHVDEYVIKPRKIDGKIVDEKVIQPKIEKIKVRTRGSSNYKEIKNPLNFDPSVDGIISDTIGSFVTDWRFIDNAREPEFKLFAIPTTKNRLQYEEASASFYEEKLKEKLYESEQKVEKNRKLESAISKTTNKIAGTN